MEKNVKCISCKKILDYKNFAFEKSKVYEDGTEQARYYCIDCW